MKNKKPTEGNQYLTDLPQDQISFDVSAFDETLRSHGTKLVHYKAMRNPIGMTDKYDIRRPDEEAINAGYDVSNGFIYKPAGEVTVFFYNNSMNTGHKDIGMIDNAQAVITVPRFYDSDPAKRVYLSPYDRLCFKDCEISVPTWETVATSASGIDRLQYPAISVEYVIDNHGVEYFQDKDFVISNGNIQWLTQHKPGMNVKLGRPDIYVIRYLYQAHYYVKQLIHEVRVSQHTDPATYERTLERMPYQAVIQREYAFLSDRRSEDGKDKRDARTPEEGGNLGPR